MSREAMEISDYFYTGQKDTFIKLVLNKKEDWTHNDIIIFLRSCIVHDEISIFNTLIEAFNINLELYLKTEKLFKTACTNSAIHCLTYFFEHFNVSPATDGGFEWAVCQNQLEAVKFLVEKGADITSENSLALIISCRERHEDITDYLLTLPIFINQKQIIDDNVISQDTKNYLLSCKEKIELANKLDENLHSTTKNQSKIKV